MTGPTDGTQQFDAEPRQKTKLSAIGQARLDQIKARNALVTAINGQAWGASLTPIQQRAFAEYMRRFRLDVSEIDNLGGRPYRNGRYYMRRAAELTREGRVVDFHCQHIGPDAQLDRLATNGDEWAIAESTRRLRERIRHAVPESATFAYVVTVFMRVGDTDTTVKAEGCKWYEPGRTKMVWKNGKQVPVNADPVGDQNPVTSVETRAWRRAGRLAFAEIPELREEEALLERAADDTQAAVIEEAVRAEDERDALSKEPAPIDHGGDDPYGEGQKAPAALGAGPMPDFRATAKGDRERVASTVPDTRAAHDHGPELEFQDDTDLID